MANAGKVTRLLQRSIRATLNKKVCGLYKFQIFVTIRNHGHGFS
jgi:hypothetical protein